MTSAIGAWVLSAAVVLGGVLAGAYFVFSVGVMPGLAAGSDTTLVTTMQQVNRAIVNPMFMLVLFGAPMLAVLGAVLQPSALTIAGAVLAVITLGVTIGVNVPLNDALAAAPTEPAALLAQARSAFEKPWVQGNLTRTVTGVLAAALPTVELVRRTGRG